jgi:hypothetical protein
MFLCPCLEFKAIERDALLADRDFGQTGPNFRIEAVSVHSKIGRGIAQSEETR